MMSLSVIAVLNLHSEAQTNANMRYVAHSLPPPSLPSHMSNAQAPITPCRLSATDKKTALIMKEKRENFSDLTG